MAAPLPDSRDFALYNGVSNRSRGWKSRKPGETAEVDVPRRHGVKRWDGIARTCMLWDCLGRDPELWFRNGNCLVHLYARGESRRGPSFRLPFSTLLASQCHPLIDRFISRDMPAAAGGPDMPPLATLDYWSRAHLMGRVDLFITPPPNADKERTFQFYLAVRNLFAWIFRRPVVGDNLGYSLAGLFGAMCEFRHPSVDNVQDLLCYLEDTGYVAIAGHSEYASAILHVAEIMRFRDLYIDAFVHCVGMYNELYLGEEYQYISAISRRLIRRARLEMDLRLGAAGSMLSNFLEDDLSETYLSLPAHARAHMDRFRTYIQGFYATRLGYYPPVSVDPRSKIFEPRVYQIMADDFQALYDYLVDQDLADDSTGSSLAQGGICVLQSVRSFEQRHNYPPLQHSLPLLPQAPSQAFTTSSGSPASWRTTWFRGTARNKLLLSRSDRLKPDARLLAQAALLKATNKTSSDVWRSEFLTAYRQFEEDSILKRNKTDRNEKISLVDARKVRWILVYAIHRTLRNAVLPPPAKISSAANLSYHISVSPDSIPSWDDVGGPIPPSPVPDAHPLSPASQTFDIPDELPMAFGYNSARNSYFGGVAASSRSMSMTSLQVAAAGRAAEDIRRERGRAEPQESETFDIRPDVDYLGLTSRGGTSPLDGEVEVLPRSRSLTRSLSEKAVFRRSLNLFLGGSSSASTAQNGSAKLQKGKRVDTSTRQQEVVPPMPTRRTPERSPSRPQSQQENAARGLSCERRPSPYHEIVVHGYGNGTNPVHLTVPAQPSVQDKPVDTEEGESGTNSVTTPSTSRSLSTSSTNSTTSAATATTTETALTALTALTDAISGGSVTGNGREPSKSEPIAKDSQTAGSESQPTSRPASIYSNASANVLHRQNAARPALSAARRTETTPNLSSRHSTAQLQAQPQGIPRTRSMYSLTSTKGARQDHMTVPLPGVVRSATNVRQPAMPTRPPPAPASRPNSTRHRRFSVYGGGDEYAGVLPVSLPQPTPVRRSSALLRPSAPDAMPRSRSAVALEAMTVARRSVGNTPQRPMSCFQPVTNVQQMPYRPRRTLDHQTGGKAEPFAHQKVPAALSRASSSVSVSALRSVNEEGDEQTTAASGAAAAAAAMMAARSRARPVRYRHSSYLGGGGDSPGDDAQPEWEKFTMGLGGHTVV